MTRALPLLLVLSMVGSAAEPEGGDLEDLEGLLSTGVASGASQAAERTHDAPATITVVSGDELRRLGLRTLHEAINFLSVGLVAQDPLHSVEVGSRGVLLSADYGSHVLLLVDGHAMNEQWNGTAYFEQGAGVPLELIDRVELIVGPGSVLYGSSAMLGVVNVVTKRARDLKGLLFTSEWGSIAPQDVHGNPELSAPPSRFGGFGRISLLGGVEGAVLGQPAELTVALEYYGHVGQGLTFPVQDGVAGSWGPRAPGPGQWGGTTTDSYWTEAPTAFLRARWGDLTLWARGGIYSRGAPAYDALGVAGDFDQPNLERDRTVNLELRWSRTLSPRLRLLARGYLDFYGYVASTPASSWDVFGGTGDAPPDAARPGFGFRQEMRAGSRWGGVELQGTWDWLGDGRFPLLLGVDGRGRMFRDTTLFYTRDENVFDTLNTYEANEWQVAVYAQQRARVSPALHFNVGARLDLQDIAGPRVSPRAAVVWHLPWEGRVKAVFSTAFRTPSGYERFSQYENTQVRNPGLIPEAVLGGELGYEQRVGRHRFFVGGFASHFINLIHYQPAPLELGDGLFWYVNQGEILNAGGQAGFEGGAGRLSYAANVTGAFNWTDDPLVASPGWFGNARVSARVGEGDTRLSLLAAFSGERLITAALATGEQGETWAPGTEKVPPQVELRAVVDGEVPGVKGLWLRGVVGGAVMPFSPYTVGPRQVPEGAFTTPSQAPNTRLFVMLTASWAIDPQAP